MEKEVNQSLPLRQYMGIFQDLQMLKEAMLEDKEFRLQDILDCMENIENVEE